MYLNKSCRRIPALGELVVSIDIGTSKICVAYGKIDENNQLLIQDIAMEGCSGLRKGVIVDTEMTSSTIRKVINRLEDKNNIKIRSAYTNITGGHIRILNSSQTVQTDPKSREVSKEDIKKIYEAMTSLELPPDRDVVDVIPYEFILDGYGDIKSPLGMFGSVLRMDGLVVLGKVTSVQNIVKSVEKAGLGLDGILLNCMADSKIVLHDDEKESGTLLINIGAGITDISFFESGRLKLYTSIPVGGSHITNDISVGLDISVKDAEKNKRQYELALTSLIKNDQEISLVDINDGKIKNIPVSKLVEIIEARVNEIFLLCRNLVERTGIDVSNIHRAVLTGGGISYIDGAVEIAKSVFQIPVRVAKYNIKGLTDAEYITSLGIIDFLSSGSKGKIKASGVEELENNEDKNKKERKKKLLNIFRNMF
jgi:cell division protein FtsA